MGKKFAASIIAMLSLVGTFAYASAPAGATTAPCPVGTTTVLFKPQIVAASESDSAWAGYKVQQCVWPYTLTGFNNGFNTPVNGKIAAIYFNGTNGLAEGTIKKWNCAQPWGSDCKKVSEATYGLVTTQFFGPAEKTILRSGCRIDRYSKDPVTGIWYYNPGYCPPARYEFQTIALGYATLP